MEKNEKVFGTRAVMEAIRAGREIEKLFIQTGLNNDLIKELISVARDHQVPISFIPQQKLNKLSNKNHQGVLCMLSVVKYAKLEDLIDHTYTSGKEPFFILLDRITDVRNFGAIARTADIAGVTGIIIPDKGNAPITGDAMKTSAGALGFLPVCRVADLKSSIKMLKENGIVVVGFSEKASQSLYETDLTSPTALLLGSEEDGISPALIKEVDHLVKIPMFGHIESLNVSVAAGIALYEIVRQKNYK